MCFVVVVFFQIFTCRRGMPKEGRTGLAPALILGETMMMMLMMFMMMMMLLMLMDDLDDDVDDDADVYDVDDDVDDVHDDDDDDDDDDMNDDVDVDDVDEDVDDVDDDDDDAVDDDDTDDDVDENDVADDSTGADARSNVPAALSWQLFGHRLLETANASICFSPDFMSACVRKRTREPQQLSFPCVADKERKTSRERDRGEQQQYRYTVR
jgi:hypothetical protein